MVDIEKMISSVLKKPQLCVHTSISNDLANAVYSHNCEEKLIPLLESQNDEILHASIWIASELGEKSYTLLSHIVKLLSHHDSYVRYYALDCILASSQRITSQTNDFHETIKHKVHLCLIDPDVQFGGILFS